MKGEALGPWTRRLVPFTWFLLSCFMGGLAMEVGALRAMAAVTGAAAGSLGVGIWGPRTRPTSNAWWWIIAGGSVLASFFLPALVAIGVAGCAVTLFLMHDHPSGPGALLVIGTLALLWHPPSDWSTASGPNAWWVGLGSCTLVVSALVERERLATGTTGATPAAWTMFRASWVFAWTVTVLLLRESLPLGELARSAGLDVAGNMGRTALVASLVLAIASTGLLLRGRRGSDAERPSEKPTASGGPSRRSDGRR